MMCDTCTNRTYCENEERQMCIANDYDRYDDDGSGDLTADLDDTEYDSAITTVQNIFELMMSATGTATQILSECCSAVTSLVDQDISDMLFRNILRTAGTCY